MLWEEVTSPVECLKSAFFDHSKALQPVKEIHTMFTAYFLSQMSLNKILDDRLSWQ